MTAAGLYKRIYYCTMPKVHGHVTNENGAIACIIYSNDTGFDNGFLMNCESCIVKLMILDFVSW